jgi:hypothetical protein
MLPSDQIPFLDAFLPRTARKNPRAHVVAEADWDSACGLKHSCRAHVTFVGALCDPYSQPIGLPPAYQPTPPLNSPRPYGVLLFTFHPAQ